nr:unnamed protein product [Callosobruchus chinensis]
MAVKTRLPTTPTPRRSPDQRLRQEMLLNLQATE